MIHSFKGFTVDNENELISLLESQELIFHKEIKHIPNQILDLSLNSQEKYIHLEKDNPFSEIIGYQVRYKFESGVDGTWRFHRNYGIKLKKNLISTYGKNEVLYIKEPFVVDINNVCHYKFNSDTNDIKFTNQRYMKQNQARYFIKVTNIEIIKTKDFYLDNQNFIMSKKNPNDLNLIERKSSDDESKDLEQKLYSHRYQIKYTCKLVSNPLNAEIVPSQDIRYFYRLQIPTCSGSLGGSDFISWEDFEMGYIMASSKKEARALLEDEFSAKITMRFTKLEDMGIKYQYVLKIFPPDDYWDEHWGGDRECNICGNIFTIISRNNRGDFKGNNLYCSSECNSVGTYNSTQLAEEEKIYKTMQDNNGIHNPCIYKITNKNTSKVYIGQTTQYCTFRWYQHFASPKSDSKFHDEICNSQITDWIFEVIEIITSDDLKNIEYSHKNSYISQREQYWINHYNSIKEGYNTATANKRELDKKHTLNLFDEVIKR